MKKFYLVLALVLCAMTLSAQRIAVFEFSAGTGVSSSDVSGISSIFQTYFRPNGYTMVERTRIDKVLEEQRIQRSSITEAQAVKIGRILNASHIAIGVINDVRYNGTHEYNIDVRVVSVQSGAQVAAEGAAITAGSSYRTVMQNIATKLAGKVAIKAGETEQAKAAAKGTPGSGTPSTPTRMTPPAPARTTPYVIYDYLKVFPNDLGTFNSAPTTVISQLNKGAQYGYDTWRLPTTEELSLLVANGIIRGDGYMSSDGARSGKVRLVTDQETAAVLAQQREEVRKAALEKPEYVDLGLPSGTIWKKENEKGFYKFDEAVSKFGRALPTKEQLQELIDKCTWTWDDSRKGYTVTGPNGKSMFLPARGYFYYYNGTVHQASYGGYYWSSMENDSDYAYNLNFYSNGRDINIHGRKYGQSVRAVLVQ